MKKFWIGLSLMILSTILAMPVFADGGPSLVMLLLIADDYEDPANNLIAPGVRADGRTMEQFGKLLDQNGVINVTEPIILSGRQVSKTNILNQINKTPVGPEDVLLVFFSGHGSVGGKVPRHQIYPSVGPPMYRDELDKAILAKKARLSILITDACSNSIEGYKFTASRSRTGTDSAIKNLNILFNNYEGYVSMTAASEGEVAFGPDSGGFFTSSLVKNVLISNPPDSWQAVLIDTKKQVNSLYDSLPASLKSENKSEYGQSSQNPKAYFMPTQKGNSQLNYTDAQSPAGIDLTIDTTPAWDEEGWKEENDYSSEQTTEGWQEGEDWWGQDVFAAEDWDEEDWENWDTEYEDWDEDDYDYEAMESMFDLDWDALFDAFIEMLSDDQLNNLSDEELYELFEEFMQDFMGGA